MSANRINLIISIALIAAILGTVLAGVVNTIVHGTWDTKFTDVIIALNALLLAYRHTVDVKSGNGSGGVSPEK